MSNNGNSPWDDEPDDKKEKKQSFSSKKNSTPPSLDDFKDQIRARFDEIFSGGGSGGRSRGPSKRPGNRGNSPSGPSFTGSAWAFKLGALAFLGIWLSSGFYRVQEGELGVVLRFGRSIDVTQAGWHYRFPAPIDQVIIQKVASVNAINSRTSTDLAVGAQENGEGEATLILTGDENMVHTSYTVLWKIKDVNEFLFTTRNPEETIRVAAESVVREVIGQSTAKSALTEGREGIGARAQEILQGLMNQYKMGIQIVSVQLQSVAPPGPVVEAFNDVQASLVDADRSRNEAKAYESDIIPRAEGQAIQIVNDAEAYRQRVIAQAEGEVSQFKQVLVGYQANPNLFIRRHYIMMMEDVLAKADKVLIDGDIGHNLLPHMAMGTSTQLSQGKIPASTTQEIKP